MLLNDKYRFVFVHIPKTAGTSVGRALEALDGQNTQGVATTKHETPQEFFNSFTERTGRPTEDVRDYRFMCFVRHPADRFASLHRYLIRTHRHVYPQVPESINRFVDIAAEKPDWATAIRSLRPQVSFVSGIDPWVGRFERLQEDFSTVCEMLEADLKLEHLNASTGAAAQKRTEPWSLRKMLGRIKRARRSGEVSSEPMSAQSRTKLESLYAEDMDRFGY